MNTLCVQNIFSQDNELYNNPILTDNLNTKETASLSCWLGPDLCFIVLHRYIPRMKTNVLTFPHKNPIAREVETRFRVQAPKRYLNSVCLHPDPWGWMGPR